jgi:hypothetical protein
MKTIFLSLPTFAKLRNHVHQTLCSCDSLEKAQSPMQEALLTQSGKPCGMTFRVNGPRLLKLFAVWAAREKRILFYDSTGNRFAETRLGKSPDLKEAAA